MRRIKLMADYQCHPLWEASPGTVGNISPALLPLSQSLRDALQAWAAQYDATLDLDDHTNIGFNSQSDADQFISSGQALLQRLKDELGSEYDVISYFSAHPKSQA